MLTQYTTDMYITTANVTQEYLLVTGRAPTNPMKGFLNMRMLGLFDFFNDCNLKALDFLFVATTILKNHDWEKIESQIH